MYKPCEEEGQLGGHAAGAVLPVGTGEPGQRNQGSSGVPGPGHPSPDLGSLLCSRQGPEASEVAWRAGPSSPRHRPASCHSPQPRREEAAPRAGLLPRCSGQTDGYTAISIQHPACLAHPGLLSVINCLEVPGVGAAGPVPLEWPVLGLTLDVKAWTGGDSLPQALFCLLGASVPT